MGPVAGSSTVGVAVVDVRTLYSGYSVKNQILGREIYNDNGERVGHVTDLIVAPDKVATYAIVGTGGLLDLGEHLTAVPVSQFTLKDGEIVLPNATRQSLEAMPRFVRGQQRLKHRTQKREPVSCVERCEMRRHKRTASDMGSISRPML
ncbi:PRC-barrel domain-containing protein [Microvirga lotononidis]|nr:PRC-barrel domain-containing protein [Microvirga lotononidis]WQO29767.1 PRC-barrel domain-containing protein [Microvirga lotononidis]